MNKTLAGFGIARRLYALSIAVSLALVAVFAYFNLQDASSKAKKTEKVRVPQLTALSYMELAITRSSLQLNHAMLARTPAERDAALAEIAAKRKLVEETLARYEADLYIAKGKVQFAQIPPLMATFWSTAQKNVALVLAGDTAQAFEADQMVQTVSVFKLSGAGAR